MRKTIIVSSVILPILLISVLSYLFYKQHSEVKRLTEYTQHLEKRTNDLQSELTSAIIKGNKLEKEKTETAHAGAYLFLQKETLSKSTGAILDAFGKLDKLILEDDERNTTFINWMINNASFDINDGTFNEAKFRKNRWEEAQVQSTKTYKNIKDGITDDLEEFVSTMKEIEDIDFSQISDGNTETKVN